MHFWCERLGKVIQFLFSHEILEDNNGEVINIDMPKASQDNDIPPILIQKNPYIFSSLIIFELQSNNACFNFFNIS